MTYQEKYTDLYKKYEDAAKKKAEAIENIAYYDGFGDLHDLSNYFKAVANYQYAEQEFQMLLQYSVDSNVDPAREYVDNEYMYEYIKRDQQKKGIPWEDADVMPDLKKHGLKLISGTVGLTNDPESKKMYPGTEYKFPVLNLEHGKVCQDYLSNMLTGETEKLDLEKLRAKKIIDEQKPVYVRVELDIRL